MEHFWRHHWSQRLWEFSEDMVILSIPHFPTQQSWKALAEKQNISFPKNGLNTSKGEVFLNLHRDFSYSCKDRTLQGIKIFYESVVLTACGTWEEIIILTNKTEWSPELNILMFATGMSDRICTAATWAKESYSQIEPGASGYPCIKIKIKVVPPSLCKV